MRRTRDNIEKLRDALIVKATDGRDLSDDADALIARMAEAYIDGMSDDAFRDYWFHYFNKPME